jgi:RNA polymerase sigma factor (sigma-70 family)
MADAPLRILLQHLHRRRAAPGAGGPDDAELLGRFVRSRDEAAFELLVWRHGTLVYNVCRRLLRDAHAAEDAFQATFLVLLRKAASIGRGPALAGWLYRVAYRVALRARARPAPRPAGDLPEPAVEAADDVLWRDLRPVLDEEVGRLPEKYRLPVVLCYLSGLTTDEAGRHLGVPRGTVLSRLAWARQRLGARLSARGVTLSAALLGALLSTEAAAPASAVVVTAAVRAALAFASGRTSAASAAAVTLMEGVLRDMVLTKVKNGLLIVLGLAVVGLGVGLWASHPATAEPVERKREEAARPAVVAAPPAKEPLKVPEAVRPIGVWERIVKVDDLSLHVTLHIDANRIKVTYSGPIGENGSCKVVVEGDYSVTRDYVLYGVVTNVDVPEASGERGKKLGGDALELGYLLIDHPFSLRYRPDENVLILKSVNLGLNGLGNGNGNNNDKEAEMQILLCGTYKRKGAGKEDPAP